MMYICLTAMLLVLTVTLAVIIRFTFVLKGNIMHNRCHTDSINIEDAHGHTEPHV